MPRRLPSNALALLTGGFALFALLAYLRTSDSGAEPGWQAVETVSPASPAPSADNVDPGFHARLMTLRDRLTASPDDTTALLEAARLEQDAHQLAASAEHYERFLALATERRQVWLDLANVYAGLGQWDDAREASERMLVYFPDDPSARYNLGAIAANGGDYDAARQHWTAVRDSHDEALASQAATSLAQLDGLAASPPRRPAERTGGARSNPHADFGQPVMARRIADLD